MSQASELLNTLNKMGFKYEHYPEKSLIKVEGHGFIPLPMFIPMVVFHQGNKKRIELMSLGDELAITIRDYEGGGIADFKLPKNWKVKFGVHHIEIYY